MRRVRQRPIHHTARTCVGCRRRDDRSALLRVVAEQAHEHGHTVAVLVVPDPRHRLPGRGAWLHPTPECLELAVRRKAFGRALRVKAPLDVTRVSTFVHGAHEQSVVTDPAPGSAKHVSESGFDADEHPMSTHR